MKAKEIIDLLNKLAPPFLIDSWDNSGLQIGSKEILVKKVLISLDLSRGLLNKAINEDVDMIITHHPFLFEKLTNISLDDERGSMIGDLIKNDITVFSMHTNLDIAEGGINDLLCEKLGAKAIKPLSEFTVDQMYIDELDGKFNCFGYGRVAELENEISLLKFSKEVSEKLASDNLRVYGDIDKKIKRIAVCGGSGSSFIMDASRENADAYITGDIKYHDAQLAKELDLVVLDAGHFETEVHCIDLIKEYLKENTEDLEIIEEKKSLAMFITIK